MQMITRLRDHIERLDDGITYAADDLAVVLRALLCESNGNRVLRRLYEANGLKRPEILISRPPLSGADVQFSVGSIPVQEIKAKEDGAVSIPLKRWPRTPVAVVKLGQNQRTYTWESFLNDYANKWGGAHLDTVVPSHLQFLDYYAAGGFCLSSYLLRVAAVEVWRLGQNALSAVIPDLIGKSLSPEERGQARYVAEGGIGKDPRDLSYKGKLQWFNHSSDSVDMVWYVDETSQDNALQITLGKIPYNVTYARSLTPSEKRVPPAFQAPRHRAISQPLSIDQSALKQITATGTIRTFSELEALARA